MRQGWIKIYRDIIDNPIWRDSTPEQCKILITLLSMASWKESSWDWLGEKKKLQPGQFVTSLKMIVNFAGRGVSERNVRTSLTRFESYGFLTCKATNKGRLITIVNWGKYQEVNDSTDKQTDKQLTSKRQATDKQLTVNRQANNKEGKKVRKEEGKKYKRDIEKSSSFPSLDEVTQDRHESDTQRNAYKCSELGKISDKRQRSDTRSDTRVTQAQYNGNTQTNTQTNYESDDKFREYEELDSEDNTPTNKEGNEKENEERKEEKRKVPYDLLKRKEVNKEEREKAREEIYTEEKVVGKGTKNNIRQMFVEYAGDDSDLLDAFLSWKEAREKIKKPFTERAVNMALKKLDELSNGNRDMKIKIVDQSVMHCWIGLFPLMKDTRNYRHREETMQERGQRFMRAMDEA